MRGLGELEAAIMSALWRAEGPLPVRDIRESMVYDRELAYTTVMTVTNILHQKGLLEREKTGRAWVYWPRETHAEFTARVMGEVLRTGPDPGATLLRFVERFSDEDMARLHHVFRQVRDRRAGGPLPRPSPAAQ
ncbi:BlaI/MecI/CopY family transcriptional regulator [Nocardiopsis sp. MG754419]|uniref:BlaI/MecI/CopY family transcriptional regulator n=1 Tax=Nocardiopsis sp. MG754419 TaxID=2259865 RepID=UPI001BA4786C|nr:BlaI/MecI/CopY family transcriptional regulator [Nocardiopsis sp. MG754419]MBR8740719.1 BlaI/MecI/CopY family transcriptional regulator [Nocardiopsis sp. MG754419]